MSFDDRAGLLVRLGRRDGRDLCAAEREHDRRRAGERSGPAERRETAVGVEVRKRGPRRRREAERIRARDQDEGDDRADLDRREPELELAVAARRHQVHGRESEHQHEHDRPDRQRDPRVQQRGARDRLDRDDDDPEIPVEPAAHESRPGTQAEPDVLGECAEARRGRRHLGEHPHDDQHDGAGEQIAH